ncbi:MAG: YggS family pyridoxal phosphate-dependent enzyme [Firmicutes bacterium HGW-Firmicutes-14]|nr:MAG: YggS family pyridoxal phosphate-dependent enzyme [Firmicutes bacterium HGW-Firmicutes-14]
MGYIADNIREVLEEVGKAAARANRDPSEIEIVAVTKTVPVEKIEEAVDSGLTILGENRVQELIDKYSLLDGVKWHLIGHLQKNKVKYITDKVSLIHSLDSVALAEQISGRLDLLKQEMAVLVQVNVAGEDTKFGIGPEETADFIDHVRQIPGVRVKGLMTIAPYVSNPEEVRPVFRRLRTLAEEVKTIGFPGVEMQHLSMGMSNDYTVAVEEGATLIRLGTVIFGQRN